MAELKRCPFCGGEAHVVSLDRAFTDWIECRGCGLEYWDDDWNTRSLLAALDVVLEAVKAKINEDGQHTVRAMLYAELCGMLEALKGEETK